MACPTLYPGAGARGVCDVSAAAARVVKKAMSRRRTSDRCPAVDMLGTVYTKARTRSVENKRHVRWYAFQLTARTNEVLGISLATVPRHRATRVD